VVASISFFIIGSPFHLTDNFFKLRVRIVFSLKNRGAEVPFHHQHLLSHMIKGVLMSASDKQFPDFSDYNFSGLKGQTKISRKGLHFYSSRVTMVFSCYDKEFIDYFLAQLFAFPEITIGNLKLSPEAVELEELSEELSESTKFVCISPVVLKIPKFQSDEAKAFIHPNLDDFSDMLYDSTMERMEKSKRFNSEKIASFYKFQVEADRHYLEKLSNENKKFARIYPVYNQDIKYEVRGYTLPFTLYAAPEVQNFIFDSGLGNLAHKGFGMIDVAGASKSKKITAYEFDYA
jgi:CRISPR-associated endoribonuclease Cas6